MNQLKKVIRELSGNSKKILNIKVNFFLLIIFIIRKIVDIVINIAIKNYVKRCKTFWKID